MLQDLLYSFRTLRKSTGFTTVALLTLALGIGANTAIFCFVDGVLLRPMPYPNADRIMSVLEKPPGGDFNGISTLTFLDWQRDNKVFDFMAAQTVAPMTLAGPTEPQQVRVSSVGAHYFDIFGIKAELGRTFLPDEDQPGKPNVVVLSHIFWETQFGADPKLVGRPILMNNAPFLVIGVLPKGSAFDRAGNQAWRTLRFAPANMTRNFHWFGSFARLKPGVTLADARRDMDAVGARIARDFPDSNKGWGVVVNRYADVMVASEAKTGLYTLLAATAMVLLIGCANLANLALARGVSREREVVVRASLGAGRGRLMRQFLTENIVLSLAGGVLGIGVGYAALRWLQSAVPPNSFPREAVIQMDLRALLFALAISAGTGLLFGLAPALQATRPDLASVMKDGGRGSTAGAGRKYLRDVLVVAEVALAFILLVGSGLMMRSFFQLMNTDTGFDATNVLTMGFPTPVEAYPDPAVLNSYLRRVREAVGAVPGVRSVAQTSAIPMQGAGYGMPMQVANRPDVDRANRQGGYFKMVSPSYFSTLGIKLLRGRNLTEYDTAGTPPVTVINQRLAKRYFADKNPIGQRILIQKIIPGKTELGPEISWEVVGVSADEKISGMTDDRSAGVYVTLEQSPAYGPSLIVRAAGEPAALQKAIRAAVLAINPNQPVSNVRTLEQIKSDSMVDNRLQAILLAAFGTIALILAGLGIYGVISYSVAQRTNELGIRAALGAQPGSLMRLVLYRGLLLASAGVVIGLAGSFALTRLLASILYGVSPNDPATMAVVAVVLASVAALACFLPARRATAVDPVIALRYD